MAEPLKAFFSPDLVKRLAADVARVLPAFPRQRFIQGSVLGLDELELMGRAKHIAGALAKHLPQHYPDGVAVLLRSLGPRHSSDELLGLGMAPFYYLPHLIYVAERGLDHFDVSMQAQYELTQRFTAEFSMRAFIALDPERTLIVLRKWATDPNAHVRRLVSECTRQRLPWAPRVAWLDEHPERVLELLELLKDDRATLVRRSVANNLNDLGKSRQDLLIGTCRSWLLGESSERRALVEHALRSAVKRGDKDALTLLGYGKKPSVSVRNFKFSPIRVPIGGSVALKFTLKSASRSPQELLVDMQVYFVKANGKATPKTFKIKRVVLPARGQIELTTSVSLGVHTTRKPYPGKHRVVIVINGVPTAEGGFSVVAMGT